MLLLRESLSMQNVIIEINKESCADLSMGAYLIYY